MANTPPTDSELKPFRDKIDALDQQIITLIKERTAIVADVGKLKAAKAPGACPLRPGREALQVKQVMRAFKGSLFAPEAAAAVWRNFINASLLVEGHIELALLPETEMLGREYFGAYTPAKKLGSVDEVLSNVAANTHCIGVVPADADLQALTKHPEIKIFAKLPFVGTAQKPAFALGQVTPEATGDDVSVFWLQGAGLQEKSGFTNAGAHDTQSFFLGAYSAPVTKD